MKIRLWLVTWERGTWITLAEIVALGLLMVAQGTAVTQLVGLAILAHLGYTALTSLPLGEIPGAPDGAKRLRRNQDLRSRVVGFLNEVRRVESYVQQAEVGGRPRGELDKDLHWARQRMMNAAAEVAKAAGRPVSADALPEEVPERS
jgi:hypothetical protein